MRTPNSQTPTIQATPILEIQIEKSFPTAVKPTNRVLEVAAMFGLGVDDTRTIALIPPTRITLRGGSIIFVTGPSGSGKSTILKLIKEKVPDEHLIDFESLLNPQTNHASLNQPIIDTVGRSLTEATRILSIAGLADAFIMLRTPRELSDGQRYRLALARIIDQLENARDHQSDHADNIPFVILADEFGAALDRLTAAMVARNLRRYVNTNPNVTFIVATSHEDLLDPLAPDLLIYKPLDSAIQVITRPQKQSPDQPEQPEQSKWGERGERGEWGGAK